MLWKCDGNSKVHDILLLSLFPRSTFVYQGCSLSRYLLGWTAGSIRYTVRCLIIKSREVSKYRTFIATRQLWNLKDVAAERPIIFQGSTTMLTCGSAISRARSHDKTSYRVLNTDPGDTCRPDQGQQKGFSGWTPSWNKFITVMS